MTPKETAQALADYLRGAIINVTAPGPLQREMLDAIKRISSLAAQQHPEPAAPAVRALADDEIERAYFEKLKALKGYSGATCEDDGFRFGASWAMRACAAARGLQLQGSKG